MSSQMQLQSHYLEQQQIKLTPFDVRSLGSPSRGRPPNSMIPAQSRVSSRHKHEARERGTGCRTLQLQSVFDQLLVLRVRKPCSVAKSFLPRLRLPAKVLVKAAGKPAPSRGLEA